MQLINEGIGDIRLGMTPPEVRAIMGDTLVYEDWMGGNINDTLHYSGIMLFFDKNDGAGPLNDAHLVDIWLYKHFLATFRGVALFEQNITAIESLLQREGIAYETRQYRDGKNLLVKNYRWEFDFEASELVHIGINGERTPTPHEESTKPKTIRSISDTNERWYRRFSAVAGSLSFMCIAVFFIAVLMSQSLIWGMGIGGVIGLIITRMWEKAYKRQYQNTSVPPVNKVMSMLTISILAMMLVLSPFAYANTMLRVIVGIGLGIMTTVIVVAGPILWRTK